MEKSKSQGKSKEIKYIVCKPDGIEVCEGRLDHIKTREHIGGHFSAIHFGRSGLVGYYDDEFLIKELPYNMLATGLHGLTSGQKIALHGPVVLSYIFNEDGINDGDDHSIPDDKLTSIQQLANILHDI